MRLSLRARIFVACFGIGSGIGVFFGGLSVALLEVMEIEHVDLVLADEMSTFIETHQRDPAAELPRTSFIEAWVVPRTSAESLPPALRALQPGAVELVDDGHERRVSIADRGDYRYAMAFDLSSLEPWEHRVRGVIVVLVGGCMLIAALLGVWFANRVVAPVVQLAERVASRPPDAVDGHDGVAFAEGLADDEIGRLGQALDEYSRLLVGYAQRERDFSAQASHELRTPVAITATSLELLQADTTLSPRARAQLERASRATTWMKEALEALMTMARAQRDAGTAETVEVGPIVHDLIPEAVALLEDKPVRVDFELAPGVYLAALAGAVRTVVRNLLVNACSNTTSGRIGISLDERELAVRDTGTGITSGQTERLFAPFCRGPQARGPGDGLGLAIVRRICEHYGWQVTLAPNAEGGVDAVVRFRPAAA